MIKLIFLACGIIPIIGYSFKGNVTTLNQLQKSEDKLNQQLWEEFKKDYNKNYQSVNESNTRREIFYDNLRTINSHNSLKNISFKMGINQFADMTFEELFKQNYIDVYDFYEMANFDDFESPNIVKYDEESFKKAPPESFDWRDHGMNSSVKNQRFCGACYAFAGLEGIESKIFMKTGELLEFSRQEIIRCSKSHGTLGCNGGIYLGVISYINQMGGLTLQKNYPFTENEDQCDENVPRFMFTINEIGEFERDDEELLKKALYNEGPLVAVIDSLNDSFFRYSSGIYFEENCNQPNRVPTHIMLLVGYGSTQDGNEFWILKNSYGELWGESGYIRVARNKNNHCKIASYNVIPVIDERHFTQEHQLDRNL